MTTSRLGWGFSLSSLTRWGLVSLFAFSTFSYAQLGVNATATSDYLFRGFSQTDEGPALQAGIDYSFKNGFVLGTWASNVEFGGTSDIEVDVFAGYSKAWENDWSIDLGYVSYNYLDIEGADADDLWLGVGYKSFSVKLWRGLEVEWTYLEAAYDLALPREWTLGFRAGQWDFDDGGKTKDWQVKCSREFKLLGFEMGYTDTDVDGDPTADARVYAMISKSWSFD